jgi:hypothetical protein
MVKLTLEKFKFYVKEFLDDFEYLSLRSKFFSLFLDFSWRKSKKIQADLIQVGYWIENLPDNTPNKKLALKALDRAVKSAIAIIDEAGAYSK